MSYSDIVGSISGVLQFVVACYALRVSRIFGIARVGWLFFGAFSLLALIHVLLSVQPFGIKLELGPGVNVLYEIISVLLLANIAQMETLLWKRRQKVKAELKAQSEGESKVNQLSQQVKDLAKAKEEMQQTAARFQADLAQEHQSREQEKQGWEQEKQSWEQEKQTWEQEKQTWGQEKQTWEQERQAREQEKQAHAQIGQVDNGFQEQLAAARKSEEELRTIAQSLQTELAEQKHLLEREKDAHEVATKTYEELITAARQAEEDLQATINALQVELARRDAQLSAQPVSTPEPNQPPPAPMAQPDQIDPGFEEELAASRQAAEDLSATIANLEAELAEQKQKQEQLESAYRELLTSLRQSGIAEVATLAQSRVAYIARITNLMREHSRDIGKFMTRHPRGKQLPNALSLMIEYLSDEQFLLLKRIDSVKSKLAKVTETAASLPGYHESSDTNGDMANPPAEEIVEEPGVEEPAPPRWNPPAASEPSDFLSHIIENVTETGTESAPPTPEPAADEDETPVLDPGDVHSQV